MSPEETLRRVIEILEKHKIPYMLTGSVAASYHGRPRATHDADVVIDPRPQQLAIEAAWCLPSIEKAGESGRAYHQCSRAAGAPTNVDP